MAAAPKVLHAISSSAGAAAAGSAPVVFIHGLLGSSSNFRTIMRNGQISGPGLRAGHSLDLRNHGASPHSDDVSFDAMAADVVGFLDRMGYSSAHLVGHSLGGKVAMTAALRHPSRVAGLAVCDIAPIDYGAAPRELGSTAWRASAAVIDAVSRIDMSRVETRGDADAALAVDVPEESIRGFVLQNLVPNDAGPAAGTRPGAGMRWRINVEGLQRGLKEMSRFAPGEDAAPSAAPALFLAGGVSKYLTEAHHAECARLFPRARFDAIPGAGHMLHAERPGAVVEILSAYLRDADREVLPAGWCAHWDPGQKRPYFSGPPAEGGGPIPTTWTRPQRGD
jgi:pimeloyl-ACP methyl ester carboxylesterase